jgi:hypothetical protein
MNDTQPLGMAFDQGATPTIACFNKATVGLGVNFDALIAAMQVYINAYIVPVWQAPATLVKSTGFVKGAWAMVFLDDADEAGALAYHDLTPDGWPLSKVFVKTTLQYGELVSVSASHELSEMLCDPAINMMCTGPNAKTMYCLEVCDPCEALSFPVNGIQMSDFVHPAYFEGFRKAGASTFDHMKAINRPFQILYGGYQIIFKGGRWSNIFGSKEKEKAFRAEDRRGHRSEARKRSAKDSLIRAAE